MKARAFATVVSLFATSALAATLEIADFEKGQDDWGFTTGTEFPGAKGSFELERGGKTGQFAARLDGDFTGGGVYVGISRKLSIDKDFREVRFWIKSAEASGITFRLIDATGQVHQQRPTFEPNGEWQLVTVKSFDKGPGYQTWGGAKDKAWHPPATGIAFSLEKGALKGGKGSVWIDGVEATLDPRRLIAEFAIRPERLGNVFLTTEEPRIPVETQGDAISWKIKDFWGDLVAEGKEEVADGSATIRPPDRRKGYFLVAINAEKGGKPFAEGLTSFAVITPVELKSLPDNPFGVMTHFAQGWDTDILPLIARAGIGSIRDEHYWAQVEKERGKYDFPERSDAYMAAAAKLGIEPLVVMSFENPLYDGGLTPYTPEGCDAFGRYGQAILEHYGTQVKRLEVWNEYNGSWCKGPAAKDRPRYYAQMLEHAWRAIKAARPDVQVLGCATVLIPIPYLKGIFEHGGLKHMDAVVVHPYRGQPEGVEDEVAELQDLLRKYNNGKDMPIWATEIGHWDRSEFDWERGKGSFELGRRNNASYLVRQVVLLLSRRVARVYWYLARDYHDFKTMGLLHDADSPMGRYAVAPPYVAYATLIRQLHGADYVKRQATQPRIYVHRFRRGDEEIRVCWATQPAQIALKAGDPLTAVDMMGGEETLHPTAGEVYLTLTDNPVYVRGKVDGVVEGGGHFAIAAEQSVDVLDDVAFDYSADAAISGQIEILGKAYPVARKPGQIVIAGQDTTRPRSQLYWYRLVLNGKLAGKGGLVAKVVDPVSFREPPRFVKGDTLRVRLANASQRVDYKLASLRWKVGREDDSHDFGVALLHSKALVLDVPIGALPLYRAFPAEVVAELEGRSPVSVSGEVSNNPCPKRTIKADGNLADWGGAVAIDLNAAGRARGKPTLKAQAWIAWDDVNFYFAAQVRDADVSSKGDGVQFALATFAGRDWQEQREPPGWYEFSSGGPRKSLISVKREGEETICEASVPWAAVKPIAPSDGAFRLAIVVSDTDAGREVGWLEWGQGIRMGKSPDGFRICRFAAADATEATAKVEDLGAPLPPAGKLLAESKADYSKEQGRNGWFYGFYDGVCKEEPGGPAASGPYTADDFELMKQVETPWGYNWAGPAQYLSLSPTGGHPEVIKGRPAWAVRRWKSSVVGTVRITGRLEHGNKGDGVEGRILVDGVQVYARLVGGEGSPERAEFDLAVSVKEGSAVDFAITPGPGLDTSFDATEFGAQIRECAR